MKFSETKLQGVYTIELEPFTDHRGWFARTFCEREFNERGLETNYVQLNQSMNEQAGTFRGLHYQQPPFGETKLVRCVAGRVLDLVVDLRQGSPSFLQTLQVELSADNQTMIYIPQGLAHGFVTLEPNSSLLYSHSEFFNPEADRGLNYQDPRLHWETSFDVTVISKKDQQHPPLPENFTGLKVKEPQ